MGRHQRIPTGEQGVGGGGGVARESGTEKGVCTLSGCPTATHRHPASIQASARFKYTLAQL